MPAIVQVCLLCAPLLALVAFFAVWQQRWIGRLLMSLVAVLLATLGLASGGIGFAESAADIGWFLLCYAIYCFLAASCFLIRETWLRALALLTAAIPICLGYALATVGVLGLYYIVADAVREPSHVERMPGGLTCQVTQWGAVFSHSGYTVDLYRSWAWLPLVRRQVAEMRVDQSARDREASCPDAFAMYNRRFP